MSAFEITASILIALLLSYRKIVFEKEVKKEKEMPRYRPLKKVNNFSNNKIETK